MSVLCGNIVDSSGRKGTDAGSVSQQLETVASTDHRFERCQEERWDFEIIILISDSFKKKVDLNYQRGSDRWSHEIACVPHC